MDIDVSMDLTVRCNGGPWHGFATYGHDDMGETVLELTFNFKADVSRMKKVRFQQVPHTYTYLHIAPTGKEEYNAMLILKVN